jgi:ferrochelatase
MTVVLLNMGGPNNLSEVRVFLHNMFNDKNIITTKSAMLRKFIAFMIVTFRTKSAEARYEQLGGKSPLLDITKSLANKLAIKSGAKVEIAMRYTPPFAKELQISGDVLLLPLYPQYSTTTTLSSVEDFEAHHGKHKVIEPFYANEAYNNLLVKLATQAVQNASEYEVILSAHGLPQNIVDAGDVYQSHCETHKKILEIKYTILKIVI